MEAFLLILGSAMLAAHVMMSSPAPPPRAERPRSIVQGRKVANDATPWPELTNTHDDDKAKCVVAVTRAKKDRKEKAVWVVPWWPAAAKAGGGRAGDEKAPTNRGHCC